MTRAIPETDLQRRNKIIENAQEIIRRLEKRYETYSNELIKRAQRQGRSTQGANDILMSKNELVRRLRSCIAEVGPGGSYLKVEDAKTGLKLLFEEAKRLSSQMRLLSPEDLSTAPPRPHTFPSLADLAGKDKDETE